MFWQFIRAFCRDCKQEVGLKLCKNLIFFRALTTWSYQIIIETHMMSNKWSKSPRKSLLSIQFCVRYFFNLLSFFNLCYCGLKNKCRANFFSTFSIAYKNLRKLPNSHSHPQNLWLALRQLLSLCSYMISLKRKKTHELLQHLFFTLFVKPTLFF